MERVSQKVFIVNYSCSPDATHPYPQMAYPIVFFGVRDSVMDIFEVSIVNQMTSHIHYYLTIVLLSLLTIAAVFITDLGLINAVGGKCVRAFVSDNDCFLFCCEFVHARSFELQYYKFLSTRAFFLSLNSLLAEPQSDDRWPGDNTDCLFISNHHVPQIFQVDVGRRCIQREGGSCLRKCSYSCRCRPGTFGCLYCHKRSHIAIVVRASYGEARPTEPMA
jgi:hypothetical protein